MIFSAIVPGLLGCRREPLLHDLTEREANKIITELHGEKIEATKIGGADGRYAVEVEPSAVVGALRYLEDNRLMPERATTKAEQSPFGGSREERRFRFERSMSREIEATLERVPGIREARVHLNLPQTDSLFEDSEPKTSGSGSVLLVASAKAVIERGAVSAVVAGAAGLSPEAVTVVVHTPQVNEEALGAPLSPTSVTRSDSLFLGLSRAVRWQLSLALMLVGGGLLFWGYRPTQRRARVVGV